MSAMPTHVETSAMAGENVRGLYGQEMCHRIRRLSEDAFRPGIRKQALLKTVAHCCEVELRMAGHAMKTKDARMLRSACPAAADAARVRLLVPAAD